MTNPIRLMRRPLALFTIGWAALSAAAQDEPRRYEQFEIKPGYEDLLKARFKANKELGPLKDLVKQLMADPKFRLDPDKFKDVKLEDENLKKLVQEWVESDPNVQKSLQDWIKKKPADAKQPEMKKLQTELKTIVEDARPQPRIPVGAPGPAPLEPIPPREDPLAKLTERALKQTEQGKLGEWLRASPAWKRAFDDLRGTMNDPKAPRWKIEGWQANLLDPDGGAWKLGAKSLEHLRNLPKPDLEHFNWNLSAPAVGEIPTPNLGAPGGPAGASLGKTAIWILFSVLCLLIGWQLLRLGKRKTPTPQARPDLGPWPVRPETVATRADLVRAFDYLALWTLGLTVASWNHHAVAGLWREKAPVCAETAQALAQLYEQARYTAGADILSEGERALARRSLLQIAEAL